jgi:cation:H+ antiporter
MMKNGDFSDEMEVKNYKVIQSILYIIGGIAMLVIGGKLIVNSAEKIALNLGISQRVIALTIISIGTSLPELATSIVAARKRNVDIAIGNVVGSNIFNIFFILGVSSVINPVKLQPLGNFDLIVNILASVLLFIFIFLGKGRRLDRVEGSLFLILYVFYVITLIFDSHFFGPFGLFK